MDNFNQLIYDGFLAPLVPKRTHTELDVSNVSIAQGEFVGSQLQDAVDKDDVTYNALRELVHAGENRKSWLIFASGIEHAEHISTMLNNFGISCAAVHSKQSADYNDRAIRDFKASRIRAISCYSKLTTGFNHPDIDLIGDLRPTMSIPLHIQKLGRGTRTANGKQNCMVLDFGRNVPRLGPINDPVIPHKKTKTNGDVPVKICENCGTYNHAKVRFCTNCGSEFEFKSKLVAKPSTDEIIKSDYPIIETFDVNYAIYNKRQKDGKPPYIRATYYCGLQAFNENIFPEHPNPFSKKLYHRWWMQRNPNPPPATVDEALNHVKDLRCPARIKVWCNKKFPEVMGVEF